MRRRSLKTGGMRQREKTTESGSAGKSGQMRGEPSEKERLRREKRQKEG